MTSVSNHSNLPDGLTAQEVAASLREYGGNELSRKPSSGFFSKLLESLGDPIIKIMLAALAVNVLFMFRGQGWFEAAGIAVAVFLASFVSTLSEYGSEKAFIRLQEEAAKTTCRARRGGKTVEIMTSQLVCGDIVLLGAGEAVPADGVLIQGTLSVDQSALNGESAEVSKGAGVMNTRIRRWELSNKSQLFRGSVISSGEGLMLVARVGDETFFGSMAASLQDETRDSPLKVRLGALAGHISRLGYLAAALVAIANLFNILVIDNGFVPSLIMSELTSMPAMAENLLHTATLAISVIIVAVPEGLPMMITVVLSRCMFRMLGDNVMVRKLNSVETAGSVNILFTDKTGTLTQGKLKVSGLMMSNGRVLEPEALFKTRPETARLIALSGIHNSSSSWAEAASGKAASGGNATDRALLQLCAGADIPAARRTAFVPFDSAAKFSAASIETADGKTLHFVKGAPELLLPRCKTALGQQGEKVPFAGRTALDEQCVRAAGKGERLVCLCLSDTAAGAALPPSMTLMCVAVIRDGLRPEARDAIDQITCAGVQVVMITGDSRETATAIARDAGLLASHRDAVITSQELNAMTDREVINLLPDLRVVSRALPTDKSRLVRIAQQAGLVCAMTGDGINDAPALRLADVGFAMGSGTQVAREAGDIIILNDNIASICKAILYGRTIFKSIQKFIVFQLTMNLSAVGISVIGPFVGFDVPVTVMQMLWINIIMDTLAGLAFAGEAPLREYMNEPPKRREAPVLTRGMASQIAGMGLYAIAMCVFFLKSSFISAVFPSRQELMTGFFALFVYAGIAGSFCARSDRINILKSLSRNPSFMAIMAGVAAVQAAMIYAGGELFRSYGLSLSQLALVLVMASSVVPVDCARKIITSRMKNNSAAQPALARSIGTGAELTENGD